MPPCNHDPPASMIDQPYTPGDCRLCWLTLNDPKYKALWGSGNAVSDRASKITRARKKCNCKGKR